MSCSICINYAGMKNDHILSKVFGHHPNCKYFTYELPTVKEKLDFFITTLDAAYTVQASINPKFELSKLLEIVNKLVDAEFPEDKTCKLSFLKILFDEDLNYTIEKTHVDSILRNGTYLGEHAILKTSDLNKCIADTCICLIEDEEKMTKLLARQSYLERSIKLNEQRENLEKLKDEYS
jgi:hypothetical protein